MPLPPMVFHLPKKKKKSQFLPILEDTKRSGLLPPFCLNSAPFPLKPNYHLHSSMSISLLCLLAGFLYLSVFSTLGHHKPALLLSDFRVSGRDGPCE